MSQAASVATSASAGVSDREAMLRIEVEKSRLQVVTAAQQLRRAIDSPDRAAEATAAETLATAAGRLAGFARLLSLE